MPLTGECRKEVESDRMTAFTKSAGHAWWVCLVFLFVGLFVCFCLKRGPVREKRIQGTNASQLS